MAVLEREGHPEVPLQPPADRIASQGSQELAALGLAGRRRGMVGEARSAPVRVGRDTG